MKSRFGRLLHSCYSRRLSRRWLSKLALVDWWCKDEVDQGQHQRLAAKDHES